MKKQYRIEFLDLLRIVSIFFVIVVHVTADNWYVIGNNPFNWLVNNSYNSISRWAVPVFLMISGTIFLREEKEMPIVKIYTKYVFKIVVLLFVWGIIYDLYRSNNISIEGLSDAVRKILNGNAYVHLWFLYMLIGLYIITPIIKVLVRNATREELEYFLVLAVIFAVLIPYAFKFEVFNIIKGGIDALKISLFSGYILCYVLGYYLFKYDIRKDIKRYLYIITLLLFPLVSILSSYFSIKTGKPIGFYYSRYRPSTLLIAVSLFILVKDFYQTHNLPQWLKRNIESVSRFIFGIYLIHFIIQKTLLGWGIHSNFINPIIGVPFVSILVFIISYLVVYLMDKIPIIKKLVN